MRLQTTLVTTALAVFISGAANAVTAQPQCLKREPGQLLRVVNPAGQVGFINKAGQLVIGFDKWQKNVVSVADFHDGLAVFWVDKEGDEHRTTPVYGTTPAGYVDEHGNVVISPQFNWAHNFCRGLAMVEKDGLTGFIDRRGEMVIDITRGNCWAPTEAQTRSRTSMKRLHERCGLLSIKNINNRRAVPFSEGLAAVSDGYGPRATYGFIDMTGKMVIPSRFEPEVDHHGFITALTHFSEGLAKVKLNRRYGYINRKGDLVIPAEYDRADDFSEGLAYVYSARKHGYIDRKGRLVISLGENSDNGVIYASGNFSEGLVAVRFKNDRYGYLDRTGKVIIPPQFDAAEEFMDGVARVYIPRPSHQNYESAYGYIDKKGKYIWKP